MEEIWKYIRCLIGWLWTCGLWGKVISVVATLLVIFIVAECAQSRLFGESIFRLAAWALPWRPFFPQRANIQAKFNIQLPGSENSEALHDGVKCPVGSIIRFRYERSQSGWVSAFGIAGPVAKVEEMDVYALSRGGIKAVMVAGITPHEGKFEITTPGGRELFVIVGSDKPFHPRDEVIPALVRLRKNWARGGRPYLTGYNVTWTDDPAMLTCQSE